MKIKIRIMLDFCITFLFLIQMGYHLIDYSFHKWIGIALFILMFIHNIINRKWYAGLRKGRYTLVRTFHTVINVLLIISYIGLMVSAVLLSPKLSVLLNLNEFMLGRKLHMIFTSWSFVLMAVHLGLHLNIVISKVTKRAEKLPKWCLITAWFVIVLISTYGLYTFISRKLPQRMFLLVEYVFFDYEESIFILICDYLAIFCLFACAAYLCRRLMQLYSKDK